jgi:hypothetical protein
MGFTSLLAPVVHIVLPGRLWLDRHHLNLATSALGTGVLLGAPMIEGMT